MTSEVNKPGEPNKPESRQVYEQAMREWASCLSSGHGPPGRRTVHGGGYTWLRNSLMESADNV